MIDNLSQEIIKRILADIGATPGMFGKVGLVDPLLKLAKTIKVRYDDRDRQHDIYAGQVIIGQSSKLRGLFIDLTVDMEPEYLFVFRMDELPIHALRAVYDSSNDCFFRVFDSENTIWKESSLYMKARILSDFERFVSWGLLWQDCHEIDDLYKAAIELIR
jgi:hypothetical protein